MGKYLVDDIPYEIDDNLDINETVRQIRLSEDHFKASTKTTTQGIGDAIGENVRGGITAAGDLVAGVPGMVAAAVPAAITGLTEGPQAGSKLFGQIAGAMNAID